MLTHRHSWIWTVLGPETRHLCCVGDDPGLPKLLRRIGYEVDEHPVPGAEPLDAGHADAILVAANGDAAAAVASWAAAGMPPGGVIAVPVAGGDRTPPRPVPRVVRVLELAASPLPAISAELAGRRVARAMRRAGLEVSRELTGDRARTRYGLGSGGWITRHRVPLGSIVSGAHGERPRSVVEEATDRAARSLGRSLVRRSAEVFETGKLGLELVDSAGVGYFLSIAPAAPSGGLARSSTSVQAVLRADPPTAVRERIMEPLAEGSIWPVHYVLERMARGTHPIWMTARLWQDCVEFLAALHPLGYGASAGFDLAGTWPDLDLGVEFLRRHAGLNQASLIERIHEEVSDRVGDMRLGVGHGDFWGRNLIVRRGRLRAVLDWEWAGSGSLPMLDVLDLRGQLGPRRSGGVPPGRNFSEVLWPLARRGGDERIRFACEATGTPADRRALEGLTIAHWLLRTARAGTIRRQRRENPQWIRENVLVPLAQIEAAFSAPEVARPKPAESTDPPARRPIASGRKNGERPAPRPAPPSDLVVLCYHAVSEDWASPLAVTPGALESQLRRLVSRGYQGATFSDAVLAPPGSRIVAVTFDDAYRSIFDLGLPILERLGLPGSVFAPTAFPGGGPMSWPGIEHWIGGPHERELVPMSWEQLSRLVSAGWEVGSHTRTHPKLTTLDDEVLAEELRLSREECETHLGIACRSLAYPYGDHDHRVIEATAVAGYDTACTLPTRFQVPVPLRWPRIGVYHDDDAIRFRFKTSPTVRWFRASRGWELVGALRGRPRVS